MSSRPLHDEDVGLKSWEAEELKKVGGLEPSSLIIEVYAYAFYRLVAPSGNYKWRELAFAYT